jgi:hypothetical protein
MNQKEKYSRDERGNMAYGGDSGPARNTATMRSFRITHILPCLADADKIRAISTMFPIDRKTGCYP